jgi:hypothetical protein
MADKETTQPATSANPTPDPAVPASTYRPGRLSEIPVGKFPEWWRKGTVNPIGSMLVGGALAALPTYFAAPWIAKKLYQKVGPTLSPQARREWEEELRTNGRASQIRLALAAASLPAAFTLLNNWNRSKPVASLTRWNYANKPT